MVSSAVISRGGACALTAPVLAAALICAMPAAAQETPPPAQDAAAEQNVTLEIQAYDIQGNTLLDALAVETAVYPYLGPDRTPADVEKAREALEKAYHAKGYQSVVVDVPQQRADSGVVKLAVTEAPIGRVRVEGSRYFSPEVIKRQTAALVPGQTPNLTMAQAQITDLNRNPDRRVTPLLKAGKVPGTVDVELKVSDTLPLHASLELNNDHAAGTSDLRLSGTVRYTNLWQQGHSISATYVVAPQKPKDAQVYAGSYLAPIWGTPWSVLAFGYSSNSELATLGGVSVLGDGYSVGFRGIYQLPSWLGMTQSFNAGLDYKDFLETVTLKDKPTDPDRAPISYVPLVAAYSLSRATDASTSDITLSVTAALRGVGSDASDFYNKRFNATGNFVHLNVDAEHTQTFKGGIAANIRFASQLTDQPLVSAEQFSAGGMRTVRGYLQSEAVGDNGVFGSLEMRSPTLSPYLGALGSRLVDEWRIYVFMDAAGAWVLHPLAEQNASFQLMSVGAGTRFQILKYLYGDVMAGLPLTDAPATKAGKPLVTFSLKSEF